MGTVPNPPAKADDEAEHDAAVRWEAEMRRAERIEKVRNAVYTLATGEAGAPLRRPILFFIAAAALAFAQPVIVGAIGLVALLALAYTDRVIRGEDD